MILLKFVYFNYDIFFAKIYFGILKNFGNCHLHIFTFILSVLVRKSIRVFYKIDYKNPEIYFCHFELIFILSALHIPFSNLITSKFL